jgi:hypothetical protein
MILLRFTTAKISQKFVGGALSCFSGVKFDIVHFAYCRLVYRMDYFTQSLNQGYKPLDYSKGWRKTGIFSLKAYFLRPN